MNIRRYMANALIDASLFASSFAFVVIVKGIF